MGPDAQCSSLKAGSCTPVVPATSNADFSGAGAYDQAPHYANSPALRKFVDDLPVIPVATPLTTYPGADYYDLAVEDYAWKMHSDFTNPTPVRGYTQTGSGLHSYLGPVIVAERNKPVRVKLTNKLTNPPFLPVDTSLMGAGDGPPIHAISGRYCTVLEANANPTDCIQGKYSLNRAELHLHGGFTPWISDGTPHQWITAKGDPSIYKKGVSFQNIQDMIPDKVNQPLTLLDDGQATYYYPNQQSARMMWYHDHTLALTRLNVYAGQAAPYILTDAFERALMATLPLATNVGLTGKDAKGNPVSLGVPLVIQDRTFVTTKTTPAPTLATDPPQQTATTIKDPRWALDAPAAAQTDGALWFPHVYQPNQLPVGGMSPYGRWDYAPWVGPPGTIFNSKPPTISGVPESFMDTMVVNGKAYPKMEVPKQAVRFRVLNASNDRTLNLQLYYAVSGNGIAGGRLNSGTYGGKCNRGGLAAIKCTEVGMVRALGTDNGIRSKYALRTGKPYAVPGVYPGQVDSKGVTYANVVNVPFDDRDGGVPDPRLQGPPFIQIGNEGGLLPSPVVHYMQAIDYEYDRKNINALNVRNNSVEHPPGCPACRYPLPGYTLLMGPAERADIIIDFSQVPDGSTLILYNDAPAPLPGMDPRYDLYTYSYDLTSTGGAPETKQGYGPNTRTIMQFHVNKKLMGPAKAAAAVDLAALTTGLAPAFNASHGDPIDSGKPLNPAGVDANNTPIPSYIVGSIDPPQIVPLCDGTLTNCASVRLCEYGTSCLSGMDEFPTCPGATPVADVNGNFTGGYNNSAQPGYRRTCGFPVRMKTIAEDFDPVFGRMNAKLGTEQQALNSQGQNTFGYYYADPKTESVREGETEIWNIVHNGVDTHAIHFHLMNVQLINRVDWAGILKQPDANEQGWRETIKVHPLENTIIAVRMSKPTLPVNFVVPLSNRPYDVSSALGTVDPNANALFPFTFNTTVNAYDNFDWEYVWHCHLLGHEENDMMRPMSMKPLIQ